MAMRQIILILLALFICGCAQIQKLPTSTETIKASLIGSWSGGGEHWTLNPDGTGYRTAYITPHVPFDGPLNWSFENASLRVKYLKESDWYGKDADYQILKLTGDELVIISNDEKDKLITVTRNVD